MFHCSTPVRLNFRMKAEQQGRQLVEAFKGR